MYDGKRSIAEKIVYGAFDQIEEKVGVEPTKVFHDGPGLVKALVVHTWESVGDTRCPGKGRPVGCKVLAGERKGRLLFSPGEPGQWFAAIKLKEPSCLARGGGEGALVSALPTPIVYKWSKRYAGGSARRELSRY